MVLTMTLAVGPLQAADHAAADVAVLVNAIQTQMLKDKEFALESALSALAAPGAVKVDTKRKDESDPESCAWPVRKPAEVTDDEWQALRRSIMPQPGEFGCSSYVLIDMDEDGRRDALQRTYIGGTGLFTYYSAYKRVGQGFVMPSAGAGAKAKVKPNEEDSQELFSTNDRGANQWYQMVRLQGRFYIAYVDGSFGQDQITLLRPTAHPSGVATLSVHYRYQFSVPRRQTFGPEGQQRRVDLSPALQSTLERALARYVTERPTQALPQACPAPAGASEEERARYAGFGPGHYSIETVADFPFWWQGHCHVAQLISWFGRYDRKDGLLNRLRVRRADKDEEGLEYEVRARRQITKVNAPG
ncbi:MAG: hypothetical protein C4K60_15655 [Ideonella sp. MAG2]|nr:MAG: hypothetical protein C4K60_15655 [Ideonella sp. MAG2]